MAQQKGNSRPKNNNSLVYKNNINTLALLFMYLMYMEIQKKKMN